MSVAAVVVTHNRLALLRQCLAALDTQTRRPDAIYIVDNASTDGTTDAVAERCAGRDDLHHLRLRENRGGAGGFHAGMARAYSDGHEWIWVMDDDSLPRPDCAQQLIDAQTCYPARWKAKVLASRVEWTDGREHPLNRVAPKRRFHRGFARLAQRRGHLSIRCASFVSIAFHRDCIARFGLPIAAYFIWSDDIEYTARVLRRLPGIQVPASVAVHATGEPTGTLDAPPERFRYYVRNHRAMLLHSDAFRHYEQLASWLRYVWTLLRWSLAHRWLPPRSPGRRSLAQRPNPRPRTPRPRSPYAHVVVTTDWNDATDRLVAENAREPGLLISPLPGHSLLLPPRWRFCCLTANRPGCDRLLPLRRIRTRHAHLMIDRRLSHEFFRCELGFLMLRTATRDRLGGPYRRCLLLLALGEKIALRLALLALRQARRLVAAVLPLLVALRIGRGGDGVAIPAADIATCRHDLASWWQGNSLNRAFVRSRWRMFLSYLKGFLAGHWSRRRQATIDTPEALARILIINPDLVGDTLTAIPLIRAVRQHLPAAQIDFLASPKGAEVLAGCPWLDRIHVYDLPNPNNHHGVVDRRARRATAELMRELRARTYDLAIDCSWWPERSLIHHAVRARYDIVRPNPEFLVWRALRPGDADGWIFDQILELLTPLGIRPEEPRLELWIGDDERASVARRLPPRAPGRIRVAVQTWAPFVPRRYPPRAFMSAIARHPLAERFDIVAFDPPNRLTGPLLRRAVATTGAWPLREAIVAMAECDLFVGNDGGMAHIAASCGLPGVVVFTSIRPEQWRPCGRLLPLHAAAALTCSGCGMRFCPTGDMTCQRLLDPAAITAAIDRSIGQR